MTDNLITIRSILGSDVAYMHFAKRIQREQEERGSLDDLDISFSHHDIEPIGFYVLAKAGKKLKQWEKTFKEEEWVAKDFSILPGSLELLYMYIRKEYRRKGFGKMLLKKALTQAKVRKAPALYAYVNDRNGAARDFYLSQEAVIIRDFSEESEPGEETYPAFLMWDLARVWG